MPSSIGTCTVSELHGDSIDLSDCLIKGARTQPPASSPAQPNRNSAREPLCPDSRTTS
jgi:hypothetical protein